MKYIQPVCLLIFLFNSINANAQKSIRIQSPDHHIVFTFRLDKKAPVYQLTYKGKKLIDRSTLGLVLQEEGDFADGLTTGKTVFRSGDETYDLVVGKAKTIHSHYEEAAIPLISTIANTIKQI